MKKPIFLAVALLVAAGSANAQFGVFTASETTRVKDPVTGIRLEVLTDTDGNDKFLYQTDPMWTADGNYLLFRSANRGTPETMTGTLENGKEIKYRPSQFFFIDIRNGKIVQATDGHVNAVFLANKSNRMFLSRMDGDDWNMYVMDLDRFFADAAKKRAADFDSYLSFIGTFPTSPEMGRPGGWCVNSDDSYAYITVTREGSAEEKAAMAAKAFVPRDDQPKKVKQTLCGIRKMNLKTGEVTVLADMDFRVGHIQASRFRPEEIVFCLETGGDADQRMWYANAETDTFEPLYRETPLDWVTHETFGTEDYVYFNILGWQDRLRKQASGIFRINLRSGDVDCLGNVEMDKDRSSSLTGRGFWHCNSTRDNQWACGDTFAGSVWIINVETGHKYQIASGTRMAPDHAQPFFSPDGKKLCFQSGAYSDGERLNLVMVDLTRLPFFREYDK